MIIPTVLVGCDNILAGDTPQNNPTPVSVRVETFQTETPTESEPVNPDPSPTPAQPTATPTLTPTPLPFDLEDAVKVMNGICFESANDAAGRVFVMRNAEEHIRLYDLAENSDLCRRPIIRNPFDFSNGRILAGIWTSGMGCTADHEILNVQRDDNAKTITIDLRFVTAGDCPYELVRPFWVAFSDAQEHEVIINVMRSE